MSIYTLSRVIETQLIDVAQKTRALREATARLKELKRLMTEQGVDDDLQPAPEHDRIPTDSPTRRLSLAHRSSRKFADS